MHLLLSVEVPRFSPVNYPQGALEVRFVGEGLRERDRGFAAVQHLAHVGAGGDKALTDLVEDGPVRVVAGVLMELTQGESIVIHRMVLQEGPVGTVKYICGMENENPLLTTHFLSSVGSSSPIEAALLSSMTCLCRRELQLLIKYSMFLLLVLMSVGLVQDGGGRRGLAFTFTRSSSRE